MRALVDATIRTTEGAKTYCSAYIADTRGAILVEAEGVFIMPRWLRN